jgi:hypothetical protein
MTGARAGLAAAALAALTLAAPALAQQGVPSSVSIEVLRRVGGDRQVSWISVLDAAGDPVAGVTRGAVSVEHDGHPVDDLELTPYGDVYHSLRLTLVVDPELVRGDAASGMSALLQDLAAGAGESDRIVIRAVSGSSRTIEAPLSRASDLRDRLDALAAGETSPRLWDALYDAVRSAAHVPPSQGTAVILVTRGVESGSHHGSVDVLAVAGLGRRVVPIGVLVLGGGSGSEIENLTRVVARTGGGVRRVSSAGDLGGQAAAMVRRARGSYRLTYRVRDWDGSAESHVLGVSVQGAAGARPARLEYATADVTEPPFWRRPLLWVILSALVVFAALVYLLTRRARMCRLVITRGDEQGCRYEIFGLPVTIGAAVGNDLTFPESEVSRNHAVMEKRGSGIELVDLNSENGTFVNGQRVSRRLLMRGDRVRLGAAVELMFES